MKHVLWMSFLLSSFWAMAGFKSISIPGARCGDGSPFRVFYKEGAQNKLVMELMGGGACWDQKTCWGPTFGTWIHPIPKLPAYSYLTSQQGPLKEHTQVYLPYCNGDVWMGNHTASYANPLKLKTYHWGSKNLKLTIDHLVSLGLIDFGAITNFTLMGTSAGAIGSLIHATTFERHLRPGTKKLLLADSPGLHWGKKFFKKFPKELLADFRASFTEAGFELDEEDGLMAPQMKGYCERNDSWRVGLIQTTKDLIMSAAFGNISPEEHRKNVLGPQGTRHVLKGSTNCHTHTIEAYGHMIMLLTRVAETSLDISTLESARNYVDQLIHKTLQ